ncbi:MAG TPA: hypothetical protein VFP21_00895 [Solirubrobacterales bacterium]|nr:hypothetical protein [Solirubrobacterales bacterium]
MSLLLALSALAAFVAAPAGAETLRLGEEKGQPLASGQVEGLDAHGAIHCQAVAEFFIGPVPKGGAPGVVVISPQGVHLGGPKGGICEGIAAAFE